MAAGSAFVGFQTRIEDVLAHLPISSTTEFSQGQTIYGPDHVSKSIYLVVSGKVLISQVAGDGSEVLLEIARPDELFGESAFLDIPQRHEHASALERATVMTWAVSDMEELVMKRPRLAVALLQVLAQRTAEFSRRIESFSLDTIERRLARSLMRFSERLGTQEEDGSVRMMPLTHAMLSRYVGTSREIVTQYMNRFRKQGYVNYSRDGIVLYRDVLKAFIESSTPPTAAIGNWEN